MNEIQIEGTIITRTRFEQLEFRPLIPGQQSPKGYIPHTKFRIRVPNAVGPIALMSPNGFFSVHVYDEELVNKAMGMVEGTEVQIRGRLISTYNTDVHPVAIEASELTDILSDQSFDKGGRHMDTAEREVIIELGDAIEKNGGNPISGFDFHSGAVGAKHRLKDAGYIIQMARMTEGVDANLSLAGMDLYRKFKEITPDESVEAVTLLESLELKIETLRQAVEFLKVEVHGLKSTSGSESGGSGGSTGSA